MIREDHCYCKSLQYFYNLRRKFREAQLAAVSVGSTICPARTIAVLKFIGKIDDKKREKQNFNEGDLDVAFAFAMMLVST